jgi:hypothetical protein
MDKMSIDVSTVKRFYHCSLNLICHETSRSNACLKRDASNGLKYHSSFDTTYNGHSGKGPMQTNGFKNACLQHGVRFGPPVIKDDICYFNAVVQAKPLYALQTAGVTTTRSSQQRLLQVSHRGGWKTSKNDATIP